MKYCPSCGNFLPKVEFDMIGVTLEQYTGMIENVHETVDEMIKYLKLVVGVDSLYKITAFPTQNNRMMEVMVGMAEKPNEKCLNVFRSVANSRGCETIYSSKYTMFKEKKYYIILVQNTLKD